MHTAVIVLAVALGVCVVVALVLLLRLRRRTSREVEAQVTAGTYVYNVVEYQRFSVRNYKNWVKTLNKADRF